MASSFSKFYPRKECYVAMAFSYSKLYLWPTKGMPRCNRLLPILNFTLGWPTKGMLRCGQMVGCCWRRWQVAVGWLVSRFFLRQGVHTKMLISWQARVLERKCRFRGAGGVGGGRSAPPSSTPDPNKTSVGCKDETAQRGYFQQVDCFVASLVGSCSSSVLWVVAIAVVVVVVAVGSRCCCCGSELELELVHPPL